MLRSDKKITELNRILNGGRHYEIEEKIGVLRTGEPYEGAIRLLALFYDNTEDESIKLIISDFFNDMKQSSGRAEVIESISAVRKPASKAMLACSCWQSGLDYSDHALALAEIFMEGDYLTSLECFTVIDTCSGMITETDRVAIINRLEKAAATYEKAKQQLTRELIAVLKE
ncbi:MAG: hypothetical protein L0Y37_06945 [Bacteroidales bacterium]|nr:hypothetical protein [Bacteroidales bacterium]